MTSEVTGKLGTVDRAASGRLCIHEAVTASVSPPETLPTPARSCCCPHATVGVHACAARTLTAVTICSASGPGSALGRGQVSGAQHMSSCWTPVMISVVPSVLSPVCGHLQQSPVPTACPVSVTGLCGLCAGAASSPPTATEPRVLVPSCLPGPCPLLVTPVPHPHLCAPTSPPSHAAAPLGAASTRTTSSSSSFTSSGP